MGVDGHISLTTPRVDFQKVNLHGVDLSDNRGDGHEGHLLTIGAVEVRAQDGARLRFEDWTFDQPPADGKPTIDAWVDAAWLSAQKSKAFLAGAGVGLVIGGGSQLWFGLLRLAWSHDLLLVFGGFHALALVWIYGATR